jgi:hypothetical protein
MTVNVEHCKTGNHKRNRAKDFRNKKREKYPLDDREIERIHL